MSILIADSGSTKTDWRIIKDDGSISQAKSNGFNPNYQDSSDLKSEIESSVVKYIDAEVSHVFFYGAGCSMPENIERIYTVLSNFFPNARIEVDHDMFAAARSLCGHEAGIACILGTGANSCFYDGKKIVKNAASLGYVLGDEGSGSWLGKTLLSDFLRDDMPSDIQEKLIKKFGLNKDEIIRSVYQRDGAIRYLAGFSKFIFQNIKSPYLYKLVYRGFELFFENNIIKYVDYKSYPVHVTGSVGFYYSNILRQVANDKGVILKNVVESPIAGLTLFHQNKNV